MTIVGFLQEKRRLKSMVFMSNNSSTIISYGLFYWVVFWFAFFLETKNQYKVQSSTINCEVFSVPFFLFFVNILKRWNYSFVSKTELHRLMNGDLFEQNANMRASSMLSFPLQNQHK